MTERDIAGELPKLSISKEDLARLPEYSCSFPTGTTPGKRWKNISREGVVRIAEYGDFIPGTNDIAIHWYRPLVRVQAAGERIFP